jgi:hypothetical protein
MTTIGKMTLEELRRLIDERIDDRLAPLLDRFEIDDGELFTDEEPDTRTWEQVKEDIERHRWTPPPGTPSVTQLLREDRDS